MMRQRLRELAFERGGLLTLVIAALYLWLAPTFIADGDNAEFSTLSATGGVAHPPGYPLYVLYLRALSWLPAAPGAHTASLATALLGAATAFVLHAACRAWGARAGAASIAVAIVSGGPVVLRLHTAAEVFALNDLIVALVLWLAAANGPLRGTRRAAVLALVAGLGLANQHTCVLLAPVGILGAVRGVREAGAPAIRTIAISVGALVLGLMPYLYLLVAPHSAISWGHPDSLRALLAHFTREDYGGIGAFSPVEGQIDVVQNLTAFTMTLLRGWLWLPAVIALATLGYRAAVKADGEPRIGWALLAVSFIVAGPLLVARFNVAPVGIGLYVCHRFYLLGIVLLTVPCAVGFDMIAKRVALRVRTSLRELVAIGVFAAASAVSLPYILATHSPAVEKGVANLLQSLPPNAVVLGTADDVHFGSIYVQQVRGIRPDVVTIAWPMTVLPWYRDELAAHGIEIDPYAGAEAVPSLRVARQLFATGRPVFVEISMGGILKGFESYPHGVLFRVLPPGTAKPNLDEIIAINRDVFAKFDLAYARPDDKAEYAAEMHLRYARTWDILARALSEVGRNEDARAAREVMRDLMPLR
jgi:hypothetical protein